MDVDILKLVLHGYNDVKELNDNELEELISDIVDIEEVPSALEELYKRKPNTAIALAQNLIDNEMGDEFMQAGVVRCMFDIDNNYIFRYVKDHFDSMNYYVFGCVIECLTIESLQPFGKNLPKQFLRSLSKKYEEYSSEEKDKIVEEYESFMAAYF
jgi:hypothetical protein